MSKLKKEKKIHINYNIKKKKKISYEINVSHFYYVEIMNLLADTHPNIDIRTDKY